MSLAAAILYHPLMSMLQGVGAELCTGRPSAVPHVLHEALHDLHGT